MTNILLKLIVIPMLWISLGYGIGNNAPEFVTLLYLVCSIPLLAYIYLFNGKII